MHNFLYFNEILDIIYESKIILIGNTIQHIVIYLHPFQINSDLINYYIHNLLKHWFPKIIYS